MRLYHFTSTAHLPRILADGFLKVVESNMSRTREHAGPDVVWLTSRSEPAAHRGWAGGSAVDKTAIRFTVDIPDRDVHRWSEWARRRGIDQKWMRALASTGGSASWYVVERVVSAGEWIEIMDVATGLLTPMPDAV